MKKKTVFFNANYGSNGRRSTVNGAIEMVKYDTGGTNLFIRGPKGGLRHIVVLPDSEAMVLGKELVALYSEASEPDLLKAVQLVLAILDNPGQQSHPIKLDPMTEQQLREAVVKAS